MARLILLMGLLLFCSLASAKIYKWVDANGEVHYQDHPRGSTEIFSASDQSANKSDHKSVQHKNSHKKLLNEMEKARKQRERARKQKEEKERKLAEKCINYRFKTDKLANRIKTKYSQFSNDRPPEYTRLQKQLKRRRQYLDKYCN